MPDGVDHPQGHGREGTGEAVAIIEAAKIWPRERQRVYQDTPEFHVLVKYSAIAPGVIRTLSPRERWILLTQVTPINEEAS